MNDLFRLIEQVRASARDAKNAFSHLGFGGKRLPKGLLALLVLGLLAVLWLDHRNQEPKEPPTL